MQDGHYAGRGMAEGTGDRGEEGTGDGFDDAAFQAELADLAHWSGQTRVAEAVNRRRRAAWLSRQADGEVDLSGVLTALGERDRPVAVGLVNGRHHQGRLVAVGADVVVLASSTGRVWLARSALAWLRTPHRDPAGPGPVEPATAGGPDLAGELTDLAQERARVAIRGAHPDDPLVGHLVAVGRDVLTLRDDGGGLIYVALASVAEVSEPESG